MLDIESALSGLSLAMDAFAAALCLGGCVNGKMAGAALRMGGACGIFQFIMPLAGWAMGLYCSDILASVDHWVAFLILAFVGGQMIHSSFSDCEKCADSDPTLSLKLLFFLALATSIDAFAVGASFAFAQKSSLSLAVFAGVSTALLCVLGVIIGRAAGSKLGKRAELAGGLLLIAIGANILFAHLTQPV